MTGKRMDHRMKMEGKDAVRNADGNDSTEDLIEPAEITTTGCVKTEV